jgi:hypothetical protein
MQKQNPQLNPNVHIQKHKLWFQQKVKKELLGSMSLEAYKHLEKSPQQ